MLKQPHFLQQGFGRAQRTLRRHWTSRFLKKLGDEIVRGLKVSSQQYVVFDTIRAGDNPYIEDYEVTFHVESSAPPQQRIAWLDNAAHSPGSTPVATAPGSYPRWFFTFSADQSVDENIRDLREYVTMHSPTAQAAPSV